MNPAVKVLVTGGSGLLGTQVLLSLSRRGYQVTGLGRNPCPAGLGTVSGWIEFDLSADMQTDHNTDVLIHCAPLWLLPGYLKKLLTTGAIRRCVAMSSTSVIAKVNALDNQDRTLAERLLKAEEQLKVLAKDKLSLTILRPTLIYGYGEDKNITVIAKFIRKFGFFPVAGQASGLRQPIHVDDLVTAIRAIIDNPVTFGKTYTLAGAQTLSYRQMLEKIFIKMGRSPRIIRLPLPLYRLLLAIRGSDYSPGSANRMNQDLNYDIGPASTDFNFRPQSFLMNPDKDLI